MCQAIESIQANKPDCPFPPPWPEAGPFYAWSEYSLPDSFNCKPEVPSLGSGGGSALLLCLGNCATATRAVIFLDGPFLDAVFPCKPPDLLGSRWVHCPTSSCPPCGCADRTTGWHEACAHSALSLERRKAGQSSHSWCLDVCLIHYHRGIGI